MGFINIQQIFRIKILRQQKKAFLPTSSEAIITNISAFFKNTAAFEPKRGRVLKKRRGVSGRHQENALST